MASERYDPGQAAEMIKAGLRQAGPGRWLADEVRSDAVAGVAGREVLAQFDRGVDLVGDLAVGVDAIDVVTHLIDGRASHGELPGNLATNANMGVPVAAVFVHG